MNASLLESVLRRVAPLAADGRATDTELLRQFATQRDEPAFAALMQRHGPMVWSVCRNLLPNEADAEDAFQATFIALIRSAAKIRTPGSLGSWLYGVAFRIAQKAKRSAARRHKHEQSAASGESNSPIAAHTWVQLQSTVHDEVNRLPEALRAAFVICELEGVGQREAARALGVKLGTLSARLTRARQRLIERLSKNGVSAGLAVAGSVVGGSATAMAPPRLVAKVLSLAQSSGNWNDTVSAIVLQLAQGANEVTMTRTKMLAAAIALTITLTAGSATVLIPMALSQQPTAEKPGSGFVPNQQAPSNKAATLESRGEWRASILAPNQWEYRFVPRKSDSLEAFEKILNDLGAQGWEYCGSESLLSTNPSRKAQWGTGPTLVFKRPKAGGGAETILPGVSRQGANNSNGGISNSFQNRNAANDPFNPFGGVADAPTTANKPTERQEISVIHLQNANADSLAQTLSQLFAGHGKVLSDSRTNSLLIQADKKTAMEMAAIVLKLDVPPAKRDYSSNPSK